MMTKFAKARARRRAAPKRPFHTPAAPILFAPLREAQQTRQRLMFWSHGWPAIAARRARRTARAAGIVLEPLWSFVAPVVALVTSRRAALAYRIARAVGAGALLVVVRVMVGIPAQSRERRGAGRRTIR